jgi:hypothetical protein
MDPGGSPPEKREADNKDHARQCEGDSACQTRTCQTLTEKTDKREETPQNRTRAPASDETRSSGRLGRNRGVSGLYLHGYDWRP